MSDRDYQTAAQQAIKSSYNQGINHQLLCMATGTGKTHVFCNLPELLKEELPGQQIILAHREELIDQSISKMRAINPLLRIDKEKAEHKADLSLADCVVASVQSMSEKRMSRFNWEHFDKFVTDEAHHSAADSYKRIYTTAGLMEPADKRLLLGVTATPQRSDGRALAEIYQKIVYNYPLRQAIEDGWLVDVRGYLVHTKANLDLVGTSYGDFNQEELASTVNTDERNKLVVDSWLRLGDNRQTLVFCSDIKHSQDLAQEFRNKGIDAEDVWGTDPFRVEKVQKFNDGKIKVLCNCNLLTEGYDNYRIACVVLASPTKSNIAFTQRIGRGTRLQDNVVNLNRLKESYKGTESAFNGNILPVKQDCIIIDMVDVTSKHSLVTLPTLEGLNSGLDLKGKSLIETVRWLEGLQLEHSHVNFNKLTDINNVEAYIESINLFDLKHPDELADITNMSWSYAVGGGYMLQIPKSLLADRASNDFGLIQQNTLDKWEMHVVLSGNSYKGVRDTMKEAFKATDKLITDKLDERRYSILNKKAPWTKKKATDKQISLLKKLYKGRTLPEDLTQGKAALLINNRIGKRIYTN